jgi:glycine/D-amino acid oxidase-like deaminating enzyme
MIADFLIIGGGIAGVSAAARVSHLGRVVLLEAETALAYHASGRSAALFEATYGLPPVTALNRASLQDHRGMDVLSPRGLLLLGGAGERDAFEADRAQMGLVAISPSEARAIVPVLDPAALAFAAHHPDAWDIDTDRLIQTFAREARGNGGQIVTGARVTRIARTAAGWAAETAAGSFEGRILVNAAGAWVDRVAAMAGVRPLGFTPLRRSMARIPAPGGHDVRSWPMMFGVGESWYAKPDAGALIVSPAEEDAAEPHDAFADDMVLAEGLARYEAMVTTPVPRLLASWAGLRTFAPDRCLVIGFDPREPAFVWVAGQGGYGMQTSPAASRLVADLIAGRPPELEAATVAALSPARFG